MSSPMTREQIREVSNTFVSPTNLLTESQLFLILYYKNIRGRTLKFIHCFRTNFDSKLYVYFTNWPLATWMLSRV